MPHAIDLAQQQCREWFTIRRRRAALHAPNARDQTQRASGEIALRFGSIQTMSGEGASLRSLRDLVFQMAGLVIAAQLAQ
jgi:hypothetical protein